MCVNTSAYICLLLGTEEKYCLATPCLFIVFNWSLFRDKSFQNLLTATPTGGLITSSAVANRDDPS